MPDTSISQIGTATGFFVRDGKHVPNVPTDVLNSKVEYDHAPTGWGGWVEGSYYNSYFLNNSNTFGIPSYVVANVNIHKNFELKNSWFRFAKLYLELDNIADKKYAASGQVIGGETRRRCSEQPGLFRRLRPGDLRRCDVGIVLDRYPAKCD